MIYNYLISDYVSRENSRYYSSTHKKSELKKIYNDIVKISKESPSYLIDPSKETQEFALQLKELSMSLQNTLLKLQNGGINSAFSYKDVISDNEKALTATIDTEDHSKLPEPFSIQINKLATNQVNAGSYVYKDTTKLGKGTYKFSIEVEDKSYLFQLQLQEKTPNHEVLSHIAQSINRSPAPLKAFTDFNKNGEKIRLLIQSNDTGSPDGSPIFTCNDVSHPTNFFGCVEYFDLNHITQVPTNSSFDINGEEKHSLANEFTLNNTLHLTMHQTTEEPVHVDFSSNSSRIMTEVDAIANTYNQLVHLSYNQGNPPHLAARMSHDLRSLFAPSREALQKCGVTFDSDGYMQINTEVASNASQQGEFQTLFGDKDTLGSHVIQQTKAFSIDPMKYIEGKVMVAYPNPKRENFANPYMTSMYSGMLFNSYC